VSVSWLQLLVGESDIIASCVQANAKKKKYSLCWLRSLDTRRLRGTKRLNFLGECGFGIALWSLWGSFSLWPFWMYAQFTAKTLREGKESALTLALQYSWVIWSTSVTVESEESSNNKLEQTSWKQHYLLINLCLKNKCHWKSGV